MAQRVSDRIRLLRLELVETDAGTYIAQDPRGEQRAEEDVFLDSGHPPLDEMSGGTDEDEILLRWLVEIIFDDSTGWSTGDLAAALLSEGKRITWH